jgi:hypothetical protein
MARSKSLPPHVLKRDTSINKNSVIYTEGSNENFYLNEAGISLEQGDKLHQKPAIAATIDAIKRNLANDAIDQVYWIVDGGDEHNQTKVFKNFYLEWYKNHLKEQGKSPYWSKLKILINHPCFEYWFLLHKVDPPLASQKAKPLFFAYDQKKSPSPCNSLQESPEFMATFPSYSKGSKDKTFIRSIAKNTDERKKAIRRAKDLPVPTEITIKNCLSYPCAQIYQIFESIEQV